MDNFENKLRIIESLLEPMNKKNSIKSYLAHYTSIDTIYKIIEANEFWMSHPLNMNDSYELINGIKIAQNLIPKLLSKIDIKDEYKHKISQMYKAYCDFDALSNHKNIYILCFSEIKHDDDNGTLSMWRGYGLNGGGASLVIDPSFLSIDKHQKIIFNKVKYTDDTGIENLIEKLIICFLSKFKSDFENVQPCTIYNTSSYLYRYCNVLFQRLTIAALFTKHYGFSEEQEWRIVYFDQSNTNENEFINMIKIHNTDIGLQKKLQLNINALTNITEKNYLFHKIIMGPKFHNARNDAQFKLSCDILTDFLVEKGLTELSKNVVQSRIPFRPR